MKSILFSAMLLISTPALACKSYSFTMKFSSYDYKTCVDNIKIRELHGANYKVTFANYLPGTRIPIDRFNFHFKGQKETLESQFKNLHEILKYHKVADLVFSYDRSFYLDPRNNNPSNMKDIAVDLVDEINQKLSQF